MTRQIGERVGGIFGIVEEMDVPENEVGWGAFLTSSYCFGYYQTDLVWSFGFV
jgi:hypothetical protein